MELDPEEARARDFSRRFRGFDPEAVRTFIGRLADEIARLNDEVETLREGQSSGDAPLIGREVDEVIAAGVEAARVITRRARSEAAETMELAEWRAQQTLAKAASEAQSMRESVQRTLANVRTLSHELESTLIQGAFGEKSTLDDDPDEPLGGGRNDEEFDV
jgi:DivIVA domain-containing protein